MRKIIIGLLAVGFVCAGAWAVKLQAADEAAPAAASDSGAKPATEGDGAAAANKATAPAASSDESQTALEVALGTAKGELKNPFDPSMEDVVKAGQAKFRGACAPCHGGTGGGGMGPPLTNQVWNYDAKDDTLFRLITLGSDCTSFDHCIEEQGFTRVKRETIAGPMPGQGQVGKGAAPGAKPSLVHPNDVWRIITWIRSVNPDSLKPSSVPPPPQ